MDNNEIIEQIAKKEHTRLILKPQCIAPNFIDGFKLGAKWQAERMYSKKEVDLFLKDAYSMGKSDIKEDVFNRWLNQKKIGKL